MPRLLRREENGAGRNRAARDVCGSPGGWRGLRRRLQASWRHGWRFSCRASRADARGVRPGRTGAAAQATGWRRLNHASARVTDVSKPLRSPFSPHGRGFCFLDVRCETMKRVTAVSVTFHALHAHPAARRVFCARRPRLAGFGNTVATRGQKAKGQSRRTGLNA